MKEIYWVYPFIPESAAIKAGELLMDCARGLNPWIGQGPRVNQFEKEFAAKFDLKHVVAVNAGTSALRLAYAVAGINPGDEVITPALTCTATNTPILEQGGKPVFADVQYENATLDPEDVEHRITKKTKAITCMCWGGYPCDMRQLKQIADDHGLYLINDGAHVLGGEYHEKPIGLWADFTMFSFQAIKQITTGGEGGMLSVLDKENYEACKRRRWFGIDRAGRKPSVLGHSPDYDITELGFKYNMTDIQATIGIEAIKYFDHIMARRRQIYKRYREELEGVPKVQLFEEKDDRKHACWLFTMHVEDRLKFAEAMAKKHIGVSVNHWRNDKYTLFGPLRKDLPNTDRLHEDIICIPLHNKLTDEDVTYVIQSIKEGW